MPPRRLSRFAFSGAVLDGAERLFLTDREPFRFQSLPDNRQHVVNESETLFSLAGRYFAPIFLGAGGPTFRDIKSGGEKSGTRGSGMGMGKQLCWPARAG